MTTFPQPRSSHTCGFPNFFKSIKSIFVRGYHHFIDDSNGHPNKGIMFTKNIRFLAKKMISCIKKIQAPTSSTFATARQICSLCNLNTQMINTFNQEQAKGSPPGITYYQLVPNHSGQPELVSITNL